ncbi:hypothetical protein ACER0A_007950 [Haloimpatiens sp. FM7315]|uniref:hypothetical protein n=1 Tax=Haloimpatiens sp. FM7315 TaxID=3298609 RepID=UPI00370C1131
MLRDLLESYKKITVNMISAIEKDDMESFQKLLELRENVISKVKSEEYSRLDIEKILKDLCLKELEEKLNERVLSKKEYYKTKLKTVKLQKSAHNTYNKAFLGDPHFLKKRI